MASDTHPTEETYKDILSKVQSNDASITAINLNNLSGSKNEWMVDLAQALEKNTHVQTVLVANCGVSTEGAKKFADLLKVNTTIVGLNLETNRIEKDGIGAIGEALKVNNTLKELWLTNQYTHMGNQAELELAKSIENNQSVIRLSATMRDQSARNMLDRFISRNKEIARKARFDASKK